MDPRPGEYVPGEAAALLVAYVSEPVSDPYRPELSIDCAKHFATFRFNKTYLVASLRPKNITYD